MSITTILHIPIIRQQIGERDQSELELIWCSMIEDFLSCLPCKWKAKLIFVGIWCNQSNSHVYIFLLFINFIHWFIVVLHAWYSLTTYDMICDLKFNWKMVFESWFRINRLLTLIFLRFNSPQNHVSNLNVFVKMEIRFKELMMCDYKMVMLLMYKETCMFEKDIDKI